MGMAQMSRTLSGLKEVENVYTQHSPILVDTVANSVLKGKAKEQHCPFVNQGAVSQRTSKTIVVFVIGGITFEEVAKVAALNSEMTNGARIILGGTFVHNSKSFLGELENLASRSLPSFS